MGAVQRSQRKQWRAQSRGRVRVRIGEIESARTGSSVCRPSLPPPAAAPLSPLLACLSCRCPVLCSSPRLTFGFCCVSGRIFTWNESASNTACSTSSLFRKSALDPAPPLEEESFLLRAEGGCCCACFVLPPPLVCCGCCGFGGMSARAVPEGGESEDRVWSLCCVCCVCGDVSGIADRSMHCREAERTECARRRHSPNEKAIYKRHRKNQRQQNQESGGTKQDTHDTKLSAHYIAKPSRTRTGLDISLLMLPNAYHQRSSDCHDMNRCIPARNHCAWSRHRCFSVRGPQLVTMRITSERAEW